MIFLDTNFLVLAMAPATKQEQRLRLWARDGELFQTNAIVWGEFLCGPVTPNEIVLARQLVVSVDPVLPQDAEQAASLFSQTGRRKHSLADCMIAAACLRLNVPLATDNLADFNPILPFGLRVLTP